MRKSTLIFALLSLIHAPIMSYGNGATRVNLSGTSATPPASSPTGYTAPNPSDAFQRIDKYFESANASNQVQYYTPPEQQGMDPRWQMGLSLLGSVFQAFNNNKKKPDETAASRNTSSTSGRSATGGGFDSDNFDDNSSSGSSDDNYFDDEEVADTAPTRTSFPNPLDTLTPRNDQVQLPEDLQAQIAEALRSPCGEKLRKQSNSAGLRKLCSANPDSISAANQNLILLTYIQNFMDPEAGTQGGGSVVLPGAASHELAQLNGHVKAQCCPTLSTQKPGASAGSSTFKEVVECSVAIMGQTQEREKTDYFSYHAQALSSSTTEKDYHTLEQIYDRTAGFCRALISEDQTGTLAQRTGLPQSVIDSVNQRAPASTNSAPASAPPRELTKEERAIVQ